MKNKSKLLLATIALCVTVVVGVSVAVAAVWISGQKSRENSITIGQNEKKIDLSAAENNTTPLYKDEFVEYEYTVSLAGAGTVTVSAVVSTDEEGKTVAVGDFSVALQKDSGSGYADIADGAEVANGDKVKVKITVTADAKPAYSTAKLVITLTEA